MKPQPIHTTLFKQRLTTAMSIRIVLMLIGVWMLVGCGKTEFTLPDRGGVIGFDAGEAVWNQGLRGTSYTGNEGDNPIPDMKVWGYYSQDKWEVVQGVQYPSFMNGVEVVNNNGVWNYSPMHYYYPTGYHTFLAIAPYQLLSADENNLFDFVNNYPVFHYSLPDDELQHTDVLYGWAVDRVNSANPVDIEFVHATTKLIFSAVKGENCSMGENDWGEVRSIKVSGLYTSGSLTADYSVVEEEIVGVKWSNQGDEKDMILTVAEGTLKDIKISDETQSLMASGVELFVIPQLISGRDESETKPVIEVLLEAYVNGQTNMITIPFDLSAIENLNFEPGQALNLTMKFAGMTGSIEVRLVDPGKDPTEDDRLD